MNVYRLFTSSGIHSHSHARIHIYVHTNIECCDYLVVYDINTYACETEITTDAHPNVCITTSYSLTVNAVVNVLVLRAVRTQHKLWQKKSTTTATATAAAAAATMWSNLANRMMWKETCKRSRNHCFFWQILQNNTLKDLPEREREEEKRTDVFLRIFFSNFIPFFFLFWFGLTLGKKRKAWYLNRFGWTANRFYCSVCVGQKKNNAYTLHIASYWNAINKSCVCANVPRVLSRKEKKSEFIRQFERTKKRGADAHLERKYVYSHLS